MHLDYLKQPVITPNQLPFNIAPGAVGLKNVRGEDFTVKYAFADALTSDSLSHSPPAIKPDPYTGWTDTSVVF